MGDPITTDDLKAEINRIKKLWSEFTLLGKIEFFICLPFMIVRDILLKLFGGSK